MDGGLGAGLLLPGPLAIPGLARLRVHVRRDGSEIEGLENPWVLDQQSSRFRTLRSLPKLRMSLPHQVVLGNDVITQATES
jgi:hypothetical protein